VKTAQTGAHPERTGVPQGGSAAGRTSASPVRAAADPERTADRLLRSTAARSYDPEVDIDWSAPLADGLRYLPDRRSSLYGTPLWDRLTPAQRIELGKHEAASVASVGIWLEFTLLRRGMHRRIGSVPADGSRMVRLWLVAILAAAIGYGIKRVLPFHRPLLVGPCVLIPYAALYLAITQWMGVASMGTLNRLLRRGR